MNYSCKTCGYSTKVKQNYEKHCNRKFKCKPRFETSETNETNDPTETNKTNDSNNILINEVKKTYECIYCKKNYSTNSHMRRHEKHVKLNLKMNKSVNMKKLRNQLKQRNKCQYVYAKRKENMFI